jgi:putative drug exporter of the RND superfamily
MTIWAGRAVEDSDGREERSWRQVTVRTDLLTAAGAAVGRFWRVFAAAIVALRFPILIGWIVAAVAAMLFLPGIAASGGIGGLIPPDSPALKAEADAARLFGEPLASAQVAVVQRDPGKFPLSVQAASVRRAASVDNGEAKGIPGLAGALPVTNTAGQFPGSREKSTTIITFLIFRPGTPAAEQAAGARSYARRYLNAPRDHLIGVTGPVPAKDAQGNLILRYLPWVELGTILAIALIAGIHFRSIGAPLASLACSAVAYFTAVRLVGWMARRYGLTVPPALEPVLVVLLLGVTTDYSVFFLAGMRTRLAAGLSRVQAARRTTAEFAPIIVTAAVVYYVPFAVAVLLVSLGSDYNIFVAGRIWEVARRRPLREAVTAAVPRASRAITTAALALAAGFAMLAVVPPTR